MTVAALQRLKGSGQPVQGGAQTLKSHSIHKEATRMVCILLTSSQYRVHQQSKHTLCPGVRNLAWSLSFSSSEAFRVSSPDNGTSGIAWICSSTQIQINLVGNLKNEMNKATSNDKTSTAWELELKLNQMHNDAFQKTMQCLSTMKTYSVCWF